ncbi:MAG: hypothetical protein WCY15_05970 [Phenylobacterium sp.]|jgi:hypothetical protein|uniref:hypothetical protein n=1 Tax=Phenylobacterium sp. TaxID=1871053 RepID=UPI002A2F3396|nr:hypothetical protein [Phenylobacterium sp.]MDD3838742.1 hypothetical protein [Phenylobacterium sp.]MDX9996799.1 hypothetical protein [Phenylobacterium sp.]
MSSADSTLDPLAMARARRLLATPVRRERLWPPIAAAGFAAVGAIALAATMIFAPPVAPGDRVADASAGWARQP